MELLYFTDPMCSWCWGFSPVIEALAERFGDRAPVRVIVGGLAPGTTTALDAARKGDIQHHWEQVHEASGQPFDHAFFERDGFIYDTEPPSRAVVVARDRRVGDALPMLARLHRAFYAENRDITNDAVLIDLAAELGHDRDAFGAALASEEIRQATRSDFDFSRQLGVRGYPTLVGRGAGELVGLTVGYRPLSAMEPVVDQWLSELTPPS